MTNLTVPLIIGVISDTHGQLRPEALAALADCDHILHAGDVGDPDILYALDAIAPVTAIRGNTDTLGPCADLPATAPVILGGRFFYLIHNLNDLDLSPESAKIACVVSGHTHRPEIRTHRGVLYLNPGSCGPRRFQLPATIARVIIRPEPHSELQAEIIQLLD
jgi:hypothetical protein